MTRTVTTSTAVEIARPPEQVWPVIADYASDVRWRKGIVEMTPDVAGEPRVGTRVREVLELGGKRYVTNTTVTETGPGLSYRFAGEGDSGTVRGGRSVREGSTSASSVFTYDVELEPTKVAAPLRPLVAWVLRRGMRRDLRTLRDLLEATA